MAATLRLALLLVLLAFAPSAGAAAGYEPDGAVVRAAETMKARLVERTERKKAFHGGGFYTPEALKERLSAVEEYDTAGRIALTEELAGILPNGPWWQPLSEAYAEAGRPADAAAAAWNAVGAAADAPARAGALHRLGAALAAGGEAAAAVTAIEAAQALYPDGGWEEEIANLRESLRFRVVEGSAQADRAVPGLCLRFSRELARPLPLPAGDYFRIEPAERVDAFARGDRLCVTGLRHGGTYEVTALAGLPAADGEVLAADETLTIPVTDREPSVKLSPTAYVLPRTADPLVPVTTVNVGRLDLRLYRIDDRAMVQAMADGMAADTYDWLLDEMEERTGELLWTGTAEVDSTPNRETTTRVPLRALSPADRPGVYVLAAAPATSDEESWRNWQLQWLTVSDVGLTTWQGADGLTVMARSLADAGLQAGVALQLLARNNMVLGQATTDESGTARFAAGLLRGAGGNRPHLLLAFAAAGDFAFLPLSGPALDLSERGVAGRPSPGPVDAFLFAPRGIYRPGETAQVAGMVRDSRATGLPGQTVVLRLVRPDGIEAQRRTVQADQAGGFRQDFELAGTAMSGAWEVRAHLDPERPAVGTLSLQVDDFVPQRIELALSSDAAALRRGERVVVQAKADYFYGAAAAGLTAEAEAVLAVARDPHPDHPGYGFGLVQEEFQPVRIPLAVADTDAEGRTEAVLALDTLPDSTRPLAATVRLTLFDTGGRPVNETLSLPVAARGLDIGLAAEFPDGTVQDGAEASFRVLGLEEGGARAAGREVQFEWVREHHDYQWYQAGDEWHARVTVTDEVVDGGALALDSRGEARIAKAFDWGRYRLEVFDADTGAATSLRFQAGWWMAGSPPDTPDALEVTLSDPSLGWGGTLEAFVKAPFAGKAVVAVAGASLFEMREVDLPEEGARISLPVRPEWGPGAYLLASAYRPGTGEDGRGPMRAMGAAWFTVDAAARNLAVRLDAPEEVRPRQTVEIPVTVEGAAGPGPLRLFVAAVDEGILALTDHATPDPHAHYFGQRTLGVDLRDLYGRLIRPAAGSRAVLRSGGDGAANRNVSADLTRTTEVVSIFQGPIEPGPDGRAVVRLDLPDFSGRLRLMAVAYSARAMGSGAAPLVVRDPVVAELSLPRFLAPGDEARVAISAHNLSGPEGEYRLRLTAEGAVDAAAEATFALKAGERRALTLPILGRASGGAALTLSLEGPEGTALSRQWRITVRPAQAVQTDRVAEVVAPGESVRLDEGLLAGTLPGTAGITLSLSTRPDFDVPALIEALDRFPYGCVEQTISIAMPQLYLDETARLWGLAHDETATAGRVAQAVRRVLDRQKPDGMFSLWNQSGPPDPWLTAYAADFLVRARERGHPVPEGALERALSGLRNMLHWRPSPQLLAAQSYALYVLARSGQVEAGSVRYFADQNGRNLPTPLAWGQVLAALAAVGERAQIDRRFRLASQAGYGSDGTFRDYGSQLRDDAALIALMAEAGMPPAMLLDKAEDLQARYDARQWLSTQEQARLLLAAHALASAPGAALAVEVDGQARTTDGSPVYATVDPAALAGGFAIRNRGEGPVRLVRTLTAVPDEPLPPAESGFTLTRRYLNLDGTPADLSALKRNDVVVVVLEGASLDEAEHQALVVDLLPAGLEIENAAVGNGIDKSELAFLAPLSEARFEAGRDDRYVAAVDLGPEGPGFTLAYVARAVTPGDFALPAPYVEDMYAPHLFARGGMGRLAIGE